MTEWLKVVDCKSISLKLSQVRILLPSKFRSITQLVACLFWEQEVMCSNHIISKKNIYRLLKNFVIIL